MKKIVGVIAIIILAVVIAGVYRFNFTNDDIYVITENGEVVKYDDLPLMFDFPEELDTAYVSGAEWPPTITMSALPLVCDEGEMRQIHDRDYCIQEMDEGAAGSVFTTYSYSTVHNKEVVTLSFVLREISCDNYDSPQREECKQEQESFDVETLIHELTE